MMRSVLRGLGKGLAAAVLLVLLYQLWIFAHVLWWIDHNPGSTAFMDAGLARQQEKDPDAELRHKWVPYDRISSNLKRAVVAAEDARFLEHEGFDVEGIQKAVEKNLKKGRLVAGGSTISQQLAKNLFLSSERSFVRKGQEAVITLMIEATWSKRHRKPARMMRSVLRGLGKGLAAVVALVLLYQLWIFAHVLWWIDHNPTSTAFMEAGLARQQEKNPDAELRHKWVPYDRISIHLKRAVVAAEDARFIEHEGFDVEGIQKAVEKNLKKGKLVAGGSTISQQLAKNLFLSGERSFIRKGQEAVITLMIESTWSKRRILEVYLNVIEWGNGIYGAEAAARRYYRTSAANLDRDQAARMAAMIPNPRWYEHNRGSRTYQRRVAVIKRYMGSAQVPR